MSVITEPTSAPRADPALVRIGAGKAVVEGRIAVPAASSQAEDTPPPVEEAQKPKKPRKPRAKKAETKTEETEKA